MRAVTCLRGSKFVGVALQTPAPAASTFVACC